MKKQLTPAEQYVRTTYGRRRPPMSVFVWNNVLTDYTSGMIVAVGYDVHHARLVAAECAELDGDSGLTSRRTVTEEMSGGPSRVVQLDGRTFGCWAVYGGG